MYVLYGGGVSRSVGPQMVLEEAGLAYELHEVDIVPSTGASDVATEPLTSRQSGKKTRLLPARRETGFGGDHPQDGPGAGGGTRHFGGGGGPQPL